MIQSMILISILIKILIFNIKAKNHKHKIIKYFITHCYKGKETNM
jgi:uncharacterized protein (UPF0212 family)